ncbi:MAG TPA: GNAT family N-acetyltransferase [Ktedonobacterales bacterium]|nr:GNAT family N-acetyltransferase [Ktedonobacterales bacterium]
MSSFDLNTLNLPAGVTIRAWQEDDFPAVQRLSSAEGWPTPSERPAEALAAWRRSWPALVVVADQEVIGFCRALSDGAVTTYIAELLVAPSWQGQGIGSALLEANQQLAPGSRLDLLALETSQSFYAQIGFRPFYGFRLSWGEREAKHP